MMCLSDESRQPASGGGTGLDSLDLLGGWGFSASHCSRCGISNSELEGTLIQCAKCKKAYYCGIKCFNADLQLHAKFCNTGKIDESSGRKFVPEISKPSLSGRDSDKKTVSNNRGSSHHRTGRRETDGLCSSTASTASFADDDDGDSYADYDYLCQPSESEKAAVGTSDEAKEEASPEKILVLKMEEVEEEEERTKHSDEIYPLYLSVEEDEVTDEDVVLWLVKHEDEDTAEQQFNFSMVKTNPNEEVEIVRRSQGSALIDIGSGEQATFHLQQHDAEGDTYLHMELPKGVLPTEEEFTPEAVCLYSVDSSLGKDGQETSNKFVPSWALERRQLRHVGEASAAAAARNNKKRQSTEQPPSWVSSRSLLRSTKGVRGAAELWDSHNSKHDESDMIRLYRRVEKHDADHPATSSSSVLFRRVPLRPVGTRRRRHPNEANDDGTKSGGSELLNLVAESLKSVQPEKKEDAIAWEKPGWAKKSHLRSTGRRASLLSGSEHSAASLSSSSYHTRRASVANADVPWSGKKEDLRSSSSEHVRTSGRPRGQRRPLAKSFNG